MPAAASAAPAPAASAPAASAAAPPADGTYLNGMSAAPTSETTGGGEVFSGDDGDTALEQQRLDAAATLEAIRDDATGRSALLVAAGTLLVAGLGLFALRWSARRL
jgi:hypothetical protein